MTMFWLMVSGTDLKFTFKFKIFLSLQQVHGKVHVRVHTCTNNYLRSKKCDVHNRKHKHVIRCTKKCVPRFLILEALQLATIQIQLAQLAIKKYLVGLVGSVIEIQSHLIANFRSSHEKLFCSKDFLKILQRYL